MEDNAQDRESATASGRMVEAMPQRIMRDASEDEIDFLEIWKTLWDGRQLIVAITAVFTLSGVAYAFLATEWYRAEVVLVPADRKSTPSGLAQLGGLASLAGISVNSESSQEPLAVLRSKDFARIFIEDLNLIPVLFADEWDAKARRWQTSDPQKQPDIRDAVRYFDRDIRAVKEDKKTGLVTLSITWIDSNTSATWANLLVKRLNDRMRNQALAEAERNIKYLQGEMAATNVITLQQSIGRVLESEMQKLMLARGNTEFAYRVIDPAFAPKKRDWPKRSLLVILSVLTGGLVSVVGLLVRRAANGKGIGVGATRPRR